MIIRKRLIKSCLLNNRFYSTANERAKEPLIIQRTTYQIDEWTNVTPRFEPFICVNLYRKRDQPIRLAHEQITDFLQSWLKKQNSDGSAFTFAKTPNPIESVKSDTKVPNAFYLNRKYMLRTNSVDFELKTLGEGKRNFLMVTDLYRRCVMSNYHFPVFHRLNAIRTINCDKELTSEAAKHMDNEVKTVLVNLAKHFFGTDVKYRWVDASLAITQPSWIFEISHNNEWHRIFGSGVLRSGILAQCNQENAVGWEIGIGLERFAMFLYNIFDIRLLWSADKKFLTQFAPKEIKTEKTNKADDAKESCQKKSKQKVEAKATIKHIIPPHKNQCKKNISYIVPDEVSLETISSSDFCNFIKQQAGNIIERVIFLVS